MTSSITVDHTRPPSLTASLAHTPAGNTAKTGGRRSPTEVLSGLMPSSAAPQALANAAVDASRKMTSGATRFMDRGGSKLRSAIGESSKGAARVLSRWDDKSAGTMDDAALVAGLSRRFTETSFHVGPICT